MGSEDGRTRISSITSPAGRASWSSPTLEDHPVPGPVSFLGLPKAIRQDIYRRVLVVAHPIYVFQDKKGSQVETFAPDRLTHWLALLYVNQQVCDEARAVLYGMNSFVLVDTTQQQVGLLRSFIRGIGSANAESVSHLSINFPFVEWMEDQPSKVKLREDGLQSLRLLQDTCTNLMTLEIFVHSKNSTFLTDMDENSSILVPEALSKIDAQFKAILSLKKIIVRVHVGSLPTLVMDSRQGLGWVVLFGN
ncbi:hypothetical protein G7046_g4402 [Stylonectria norvegica]|nr:hypothetical protein G7046_g4402 [Stylonectria norvegica]